MSTEPKKTLKIEPIDPKEESAEAKRRSSARKKPPAARPKASASPASRESSAKKTTRKPGSKPSISVEKIELPRRTPQPVPEPQFEPAADAADQIPLAESAESLEQEAVAAELAHEVEAEAEDEPVFQPHVEDEDEEDTPQIGKPVVEPKLERLQKILSHAGISSRRTAEEMILGGRVQVNGQVVSTLGAKADPERDHIRVDGKLLHGPERHRYFMLNKPKGYVTTVSDPEGRPTVMKFFASERERLYPVGRLDYLSEGLLLVTNDGDLANKLTRAASGVEKTYLVKVAGNPSDEMLDSLREGVVIERGRPGTGSGRVRTAPASIRQIREGDNPWYEVTVIEGRNRELRKMFEEIGHHVEKIRRVGYGPLILDLEPGKVRELDEEEIRLLNLAAEGKLKTRRRRGPAPAQLPRQAGAAVEYRKPGERPRFKRRSDTPPNAPANTFRGRPGAEGKPAFRRDDRPGTRGDSRFAGKPGEPRFRRTEDSRRPLQTDRPRREDSPREGSSFDRQNRKPEGRGFQPRPFGNRPPRQERPSSRPPSRSFREGEEFKPRRSDGPRSADRRFEPRAGGLRTGRPSSPRPPSRPSREREEFKPRRDGSARPAEKRFETRPADSRPRRSEDANEFDRRPAKKFPSANRFAPAKKFGAPKKFAGDRPTSGAPKKQAFDRPKRAEGGFPDKRRSSPPTGDGEAPRKKERWRDSYTGKNKGRPKPKPRKPE